MAFSRLESLARTNSGQYILVEAKAYAEEAVDYRSKAKGSSLKMIQKSLAEAKVACQAACDAPWEAPLYQYANRLAHLHFLARLNLKDAYLVFIYFANAPDVPNPCSVEEWNGAIRVIKKCMGLKKNAFERRIADIVIDVKEMLSRNSA